MFKRNKTLAGILAIFLGTLGIHKFYQGKWKAGIMYFLFFWTGIPTILGILDGAKLLTEVADEVPGENVPEKNKKDSIAKSDKKDRSESKAKSEKADKQDKAVKTDAAKKEKATKLEKPEKETKDYYQYGRLDMYTSGAIILTDDR